VKSGAPSGSRRPRERPFVVPSAALLRDPGARRTVHVEYPIDDLAVSGSWVPADSPVTMDALLESVHGGVLVTGKVSAPWEGECRRCLDVARGEIDTAVRELCTEDGDIETTYRLTPDELDLEPIAHDACILALPLAPLCMEGCLGLCSECGANRNTEPCSCSAPPDPRWGPLELLGEGALQARPAPGPKQADPSASDIRQ